MLKESALKQLIAVSLDLDDSPRITPSVELARAV